MRALGIIHLKEVWILQVLRTIIHKLIQARLVLPAFLDLWSLHDIPLYRLVEIILLQGL